MTKQSKSILIFLAVVLIIVAAVYSFYLAPNRQQANNQVEAEVILDPVRISQEVAEGSAVLLDVRTALELQEDGFAVSSTHFDLVRLQNGELPNISKEIKIYTYCKAGGRAGKAEIILEENGFIDVVNIGGLVDWIDSGGQIIK